MVKKRRSKLTSQEKDLERNNFPKSRAKVSKVHLEEPDPDSREYIYDEIDEYHATDDKILLENDDDRRNKSERYEEVLGLSDDEDESDEESEDDRGDFYTRMAQKDEMASDIEGEEDGDDLPDAKAWGRKKELYYNTDYVDQDYGGYHGSDIEMAEEEEKEALAIQKRMLQEFEEDDFGVEWLKPKYSAGKLDTEIKEKVTMDLSKMSKSEKLELLKKESPEFLELVDDYISQMAELNDRIQPLYNLFCEGKLPSGSGADYIKFKHQLILLYCTNISFYLVLKSRGATVTHHPVLKRLATYKKLLKQLSTADKRISSQLDAILEKVQNGNDLQFQDEAIPKLKQKLRITRKLEEKNKVDIGTEDDIPVQEPKSKRVKLKETEDEKEALAMYELMKSGRKEKVDSEDDVDEEEEAIDHEEENIEEDYTASGEHDENGLEKRGITYQIAKNKGLTPHRKKEYRNPRVKHRMKFRKAKIRRKGQVKEARKELQRYGGEVSGIRIGVKHGIKLK